MPFSQRDLTRLVGVHPTLVDKLGYVFNRMEAQGSAMFVVQGVRTQAEQTDDYAHGRTTPGPIITYCDGVKKKGPHQPHEDGYGYAVDCAFQPSKEMKDPFDQKWPWGDFGDELENAGLIWGGRFHGGTFGDLDHAELPVVQGTTAA